MFETKGIANTENFDWLEMPPAGTSRNEVITSAPRIVEGQRQVEGVFCSVSRRSFLAAGTAVGASAFLGRMAGVVNIAGVGDPALKESDINTNGISLHVTEQGDGPAVLFCHGFPDTSYTWRRQMKAVASAGYRAIAPDMRGYGRSSAPADPTLYTPLYTAGDLIGLLDALNILSTAAKN